MASLGNPDPDPPGDQSDPPTETQSQCDQHLPQIKSDDSDADVRRTDLVQTDREIALLRAFVADKDERVRKLKLIQMYKKKWAKVDLANLGIQWKHVAQNALLEIYNKNKNGEHPDLTIEKLLEHLHIDPEFIGYNIQDESFEDIS